MRVIGLIHEPFGKRCVIVSAMGPDGENLLPPPEQQDLFSAHMAGELAAAGKLFRGNALGQIGRFLFGLFLSHLFLLARIGTLTSPLRHTAKARNSCRVSGLSRKQPSMRLVTKSDPGLRTPRAVMQ